SQLGPDDDVRINFGSITFGGPGGKVDLTKKGALSAPNSVTQADVQPRPGGSKGADDIQSQASQSSKASALLSKLTRNPSTGSSGLFGLGIQIPLLKDPSNVFKMFTGQPADLIVWDIPKLELNFDWEKSFFPVPPLPLEVKVGLDFNAFVQLDLGFNTRGIQSGNFFDGLYFTSL